MVDTYNRESDNGGPYNESEQAQMSHSDVLGVIEKDLNEAKEHWKDYREENLRNRDFVSIHNGNTPKTLTVGERIGRGGTAIVHKLTNGGGHEPVAAKVMTIPPGTRLQKMKFRSQKAEEVSSKFSGQTYSIVTDFDLPNGEKLQDQNLLNIIYSRDVIDEITSVNEVGRLGEVARNLKQQNYSIDEIKDYYKNVVYPAVEEMYASWQQKSPLFRIFEKDRIQFLAQGKKKGLAGAEFSKEKQWEWMKHCLQNLENEIKVNQYLLNAKEVEPFALDEMIAHETLYSDQDICITSPLGDGGFHDVLKKAARHKVDPENNERSDIADVLDVQVEPTGLKEAPERAYVKIEKGIPFIMRLFKQMAAAPNFFNNDRSLDNILVKRIPKYEYVQQLLETAKQYKENEAVEKRLKKIQKVYSEQNALVRLTFYVDDLANTLKSLGCDDPVLYIQDANQKYVPSLMLYDNGSGFTVGEMGHNFEYMDTPVLTELCATNMVIPCSLSDYHKIQSNDDSFNFFEGIDVIGIMRSLADMCGGRNTTGKVHPRFETILIERAIEEYGQDHPMVHKMRAFNALAFENTILVSELQAAGISQSCIEQIFQLFHCDEDAPYVYKANPVAAYKFMTILFGDMQGVGETGADNHIEYLADLGIVNNGGDVSSDVQVQARIHRPDFLFYQSKLHILKDTNDLPEELLQSVMSTLKDVKLVTAWLGVPYKQRRDEVLEHDYKKIEKKALEVINLCERRIGGRLEERIVEIFPKLSDATYASLPLLKVLRDLDIQSKKDLTKRIDEILKKLKIDQGVHPGKQCFEMARMPVLKLLKGALDKDCVQLFIEEDLVNLLDDESRNDQLILAGVYKLDELEKADYDLGRVSRIQSQSRQSTIPSLVKKYNIASDGAAQIVQNADCYTFFNEVSDMYGFSRQQIAEALEATGIDEDSKQKTMAQIDKKVSLNQFRNIVKEYDFEATVVKQLVIANVTKVPINEQIKTELIKQNILTEEDIIGLPSLYLKHMEDFVDAYQLLTNDKKEIKEERKNDPALKNKDTKEERKIYYKQQLEQIETSIIDLINKARSQFLAGITLRPTLHTDGVVINLRTLDFLEKTLFTSSEIENLWGDTRVSCDEVNAFLSTPNFIDDEELCRLLKACIETDQKIELYSFNAQKNFQYDQKGLQQFQKNVFNEIEEYISTGRINRIQKLLLIQNGWLSQDDVARASFYSFDEKDIESYSIADWERILENGFSRVRQNGHPVDSEILMARSGIVLEERVIDYLIQERIFSKESLHSLEFSPSATSIQIMTPDNQKLFRRYFTYAAKYPGVTVSPYVINFAKEKAGFSDIDMLEIANLGYQEQKIFECTTCEEVFDVLDMYPTTCSSEGEFNDIKMYTMTFNAKANTEYLEKIKAMLLKSPSADSLSEIPKFLEREVLTVCDAIVQKTDPIDAFLAIYYDSTLESEIATFARTAYASQEKPRYYEYEHDNQESSSTHFLTSLQEYVREKPSLQTIMELQSKLTEVYQRYKNNVHIEYDEFWDECSAAIGKTREIGALEALFEDDNGPFAEGSTFGTSMHNLEDTNGMDKGITLGFKIDGDEWKKVKRSSKETTEDILVKIQSDISEIFEMVESEGHTASQGEVEVDQTTLENLQKEYDALPQSAFFDRAQLEQKIKALREKLQ